MIRRQIRSFKGPGKQSFYRSRSTTLTVLVCPRHPSITATQMTNPPHLDYPMSALYDLLCSRRAEIIYTSTRAPFEGKAARETCRDTRETSGTVDGLLLLHASTPPAATTEIRSVIYNWLSGTYLMPLLAHNTTQPQWYHTTGRSPRIYSPPVLQSTTPSASLAPTEHVNKQTNKSRPHSHLRDTQQQCPRKQPTPTDTTRR